MTPRTSSHTSDGQEVCEVGVDGTRKLAKFSLLMKPGESASQTEVHVTAKLLVTYTVGYPIVELPKLGVQKARGLTGDQLKELQVVPHLPAVASASYYYFSRCTARFSFAYRH